MLLTANVVAEIVGRPMGARRNRTLHVLTRAEVEVPDVRESDLLPVASVALARGLGYVSRAGEGIPRGEAVYKEYFSLGGERIFCGFAEDPSPYHAAMNLLELPPLPMGTIDALPIMKETSRDGTAATLAEAAKAASGLGHLAGRGFLVPAREPYIVVLAPAGYYHSLGVETVPDGVTDNRRRFRIDRLDDAVAYARSVGATDADVAEIRRDIEITVHDPARLRFDPVRAELLGAAYRIYADCRNILHRLPTEKVVAWLALRDAWEDRMASGDFDPLTLVGPTRHAHDLLIGEGTLDERARRDIADAIAAAEAIAPRLDLSSEAELAGLGL